jgi:hypothetical protein
MFDSLLNHDIIIETDSYFTYVGRLTEARDDSVVLTAVTVYDERSARVPQERFLIEVAAIGNTASREEIRVRCQRIIAVTPLTAIMLPPGALE